MSKHKTKAKTVVGVTVGVAVLVAIVGVAGWLTKGFKSADVLDVTKKGTVVATYDDLGKLYEDTGIYLDRYGDQNTMLGSETVYQKTSSDNTLPEQTWNQIAIDGVTNYRTILEPNLIRTVADLEDETAIGYFDTIRLNFKAVTNFYLIATSANEIIAEKNSANTYVSDFFEIPLGQIDFEGEEAAVGDMAGLSFESYVYGLKGAVPSLQFQSIEFVNKSGLNTDVKLIVSGD